MSDLLSGRAQRLFRMSSLSSQVGSTYVWQTLLKPFRSVNGHEREMLDAHVQNALRIVEGSRELRGAFAKLVQMLSMRDDIFPAEALDVLASVQSSVPPMSYMKIREVVRRELGKPPEQLFPSFEHQAFAAASIGQVHVAELRSGEPVVVKIQYPGVERTIADDLSNVGLLLETFGRIARDVMGAELDAAEVASELEERLGEELDYRREAANLVRFGEWLAGDPEVDLPEPVSELSSRRVLTMTRLEGYPISDILAPGVDREIKDWVAIKLFRLVWRQLFRFGALHTDPHPGNYLVTHHPKLGILDFGSVRDFDDELRLTYLELAGAIVAGSRPEILEACRALGFLGEDDDERVLWSILESLLEPLLVDREVGPEEYPSIEKAMAAAADAVEGRLLRSPGHRVFLLRALVGLEGYIQRFGTVANWHRLFAEEVAAAQPDRDRTGFNPEI